MKNPALDILITLNNYSHDIATALLAVGGIMMYLLYRGRKRLLEDGGGVFFSRVYKKVKTIAEASLAWILIAGVPRTIFYKRYEWSDLSGDLQIVAIIIKHIVMFLLVGLLSFYWIRLSRINKSILAKEERRH
ncbi:MAG: hypothetical protein D6726_12230 [Nitrospirae bacterium]|nr:MAG: hypothetical protein D6726_12230 [Nitrospirota bacterium]